jgi:hypothetical protein
MFYMNLQYWATITSFMHLLTSRFVSNTLKMGWALIPTARNYSVVPLTKNQDLVLDARAKASLAELNYVCIRLLLVSWEVAISTLPYEVNRSRCLHAALHKKCTKWWICALAEVMIPCSLYRVNGERRGVASRIRRCLATIRHCQTVRLGWRQRFPPKLSTTRALSGELPVRAVDSSSSAKQLVRWSGIRGWQCMGAKKRY